MSRRVSLFMLAIALAISCGAGIGTSYAEDIVTVDEEVVTGSRIYTSLEEVPAATYVIDGEEITKSGARSLSDLLSTVPGIQTPRRNGWTQGDSIKLRGLSTELLMLVDGIPYYNASHGADSFASDLRSIPLESIERIEIVKGAGSALYGSMAAAGVINIITKKADTLETRLVAEAGSNDWRRYGINASIPGEKFDIGIWYNHREEGESPLGLFYSSQEDRTIENRNLDYDENSGGLRVKRGNWTFGGEWGHYESSWEYSQENYDWNTYEYLGLTERGVDSQENDYQRYSLRWENDGTLVIAYWHDAEREYKDSFGTTKYDDKALGLELSRRTLWGDNPSAWGLSFRNEESKFSDASYERQNWAPFMETSFLWGDIITNLGLRFEYWDVDNGETYEEVMPKLSFTKELDSGNLLYLTAGRFFAMPSFYELFGPFGPNSKLDPEKGWSYELGLKAGGGENPWQINAFYLEMDDKIKWADYMGTPFDYYDDGYMNVAEFRSKGIEAQKTFRINNSWKFIQNITWQLPEEKANSGSEWTKGGTPQWDLFSRLAYDKGPWDGELGIHYIGQRDIDLSYDAGNADDDFVTVDLGIGYKMGDHQIRLAGYNLFDEEYFVSTSSYYGPERRIYLTWEYKF